MATHTNFSTFDWLIVSAFLVGITLAGMWTKRYLTHYEGYFIAGRKVKGYLGVASIIATEMGLVTVMYSAQKGFTGGFAAFHIALAAAVVALVVGVTGFIVSPLRQTKVMTIPEFYELRFSRGTRILGGLILAFSGILNMGMFLKADSLFVTSVMGLTSQTALNVAMSVMLGLVLLYTMLGGMISVLVTDYLQYVIMAISLVFISLLLMGKLGWSEIVQQVVQIKGEAGFNPFSQEGFGSAYVLWMLFLGLVSCALWQTAVIRASAAENQEAVRRTFTWGAVGFLIRFMIPYFWGICALVYIAGNPSLREMFLSAQAQTSSETTLRAMPVALSSLLPTGVLGILTAGMLAAAMSTYNTYLHSWSMVLTQDVLSPLFGERLSQRGRIVTTQVFMFLVGVFLLVWGLWYPLGEHLWDYMAVTGAIYFTGAFAVLVGGLYWQRASRAGAYGAFLCGFLALAGLSPVQEMLGVKWQSEYVGLASVSLACVVMVVGSLVMPDKRKSLSISSLEEGAAPPGG
jgi:SSS family solute:Na+ symporter